MSRPESVSSSTAIFGFSIAICRISTRFFSPPEKPSFRYLDASSRGTLSSSIAASRFVRNSGIGTGSSSPPLAALRFALIALRRKLVTVTPGIACGYWKARKRPRCARSSAPSSVRSLAVEEDLALGHLVRRMAHERVGERRLAGAVRPHDRVLLPEIDLEVDTLDDLGAVLQSDVQIPDLELRHAERRPPRSEPAGSCLPVHGTRLVASGVAVGPGSPLAIRGGKVRPMPFGISLCELIILLLVLLLVFGAKRLPEMGRSLGKGMREFKDSVSGIEETVSTTTTTTTTTPTPTRVELPSATSVPDAPSGESEARTERETVS